MHDTERNSGRIREFAVTSLFAAIIFLLAFTPIGYINLGVIKATIVHVPVIIGSVMLGPRIGALLGGLFGLTSLIINTISPSLLSFAFSPLIPIPGTDGGSAFALLVCFVPRILVGVVPYYVDRGLSRLWRNDRKWRLVSLFSAGIAGAMTNTLLVMHLIFFLFRDAYAAALNRSIEVLYAAVASVILGHGIPEALVAGVFTSAVCKALLSYRERNGLRTGG